MTKEERGNDLWCRKQAAAVLMLFAGVDRLAHEEPPPGLPPRPDSDVDEDIARAEKEARRLIDRIADRDKISGKR